MSETQEHNLNEDEANKQFVDMIMAEDWDMDFSDVDTSYISNEYAIPMPPPQIYLVSAMPQELVEDLFGDFLNWLRHGNQS